MLLSCEWRGDFKGCWYLEERMVPSKQDNLFFKFIHLFVARPEDPHQCMEGGDGEDPQASQSGLGGATGDGQQAFWVGQLSTLQTGQVASHPEEIHVKPLQILLPLLDLKGKKAGDYFFGRLG